MTNALVYDQFSDPSFKPVINLLFHNPEYKEYTKHASLDIEENDKVAAGAFAWPELRRFRIDTPDNAVLSKLFIEKQGSAIPAAVRERCNNALRLFGFNPDDIRPREQQKTAALVPYVLPQEKAIPIRSLAEYKVAADLLSQQTRRWDTKTRSYVAIGLVKTGAAVGAEPPQWALQYSGMTVCHIPALVDALEMRAAAAPSPQYKYAFDKLAESVLALGLVDYTDFDDLAKLADNLAQLDEEAGLSQFYNRTLPDPVASVFNTAKIADQLLYLGGTAVPLEQLLSVPVDTYAAIFGDEILPEITTNGVLDEQKLSVVLPTMPADLLRVLVRQLGY